MARQSVASLLGIAAALGMPAQGSIHANSFGKERHNKVSKSKAKARRVNKIAAASRRANR